MRRWGERVRAAVLEAARLDAARLVDGLPVLVRAFEEALAQAAAGGGVPAEVSRVAEAHARQHLALGLGADTLARQFELLAEVVLDLAEEAGQPLSAAEVRALSRAVHAGLASALRHAEQLRAADLAEARTQLTQLLGRSAVVLMRMDAGGRVTSAQGPRLDVVGRSAEELLGRNVFELFAEREDVLGHLRDAFAGTERHADVRFRGRTWEVHYLPVRGPDGEPAGVSGLTVDVTDRQRLAEERGRAAAVLDAVLQATPVGLALVDPGLRYLNINPALAAINGRSVEETLGRTIREVLGDAAEPYATWTEQVLRTGEPVSAQMPVEPPSDRVRPGHYMGTIYPVRGADGQVFAAGIVVVDVTQQRRELQERERLLALLEEERSRLTLLADLSRGLAEARSCLSDVLESVCRHLATHVADGAELRLLSSDGRTLSLEQVAARDPALERAGRALLHQALPAHAGLTGSVLASGQMLLLRDPTPDQWERALAPVVPEAAKRMLLGLKPTGMLALPLATAERRVGVLVLMRFTPPTFSDADVALVREVAARAALAIANAQLVEALEDAVRVREDVLGIVGHDLKNPLNAISVAVQMLQRRQSLPPELAQLVVRIASAAERARRLISDLLDFTQARVGSLPVTLGPVALHEVARAVVEEAALAHPDREVRHVALGEASGRWDAARVAQALTNLLTNALQYSPPGTPVTVTSRAVDGEVLVEVHNTGAPIPPELFPALFEAYRRGRRNEGGNLGLGLFVTRQIARAHGGDVEVRSSEGEGTTFTLRLPRVLPPEEERDLSQPDAPPPH